MTHTDNESVAVTPMRALLGSLPEAILLSLFYSLKLLSLIVKPLRATLRTPPHAYFEPAFLTFLRFIERVHGSFSWEREIVGMKLHETHQVRAACVIPTRGQFAQQFCATFRCS